MRLLADYDYVLLRYSGEEGVVDFRPDADYQDAPSMGILPVRLTGGAQLDARTRPDHYAERQPRLREWMTSEARHREGSLRYPARAGA
jgi:hypothetical protein